MLPPVTSLSQYQASLHHRHNYCITQATYVKNLSFFFTFQGDWYVMDAFNQESSRLVLEHQASLWSRHWLHCNTDSWLCSLPPLYDGHRPVTRAPGTMGWCQQLRLTRPRFTCYPKPVIKYQIPPSLGRGEFSLLLQRFFPGRVTHYIYWRLESDHVKH